MKKAFFSIVVFLTITASYGQEPSFCNFIKLILSDSANCDYISFNRKISNEILIIDSGHLKIIDCKTDIFFDSIKFVKVRNDLKKGKKFYYFNVEIRGNEYIISMANNNKGGYLLECTFALKKGIWILSKRSFVDT